MYGTYVRLIVVFKAYKLYSKFHIIIAVCFNLIYQPDTYSDT